MFKVGDRIRPIQAHGGYYVPATVTEITERGFKYVMDHPVCIHPFLGSYKEGECYAPEGYELIPAVSPMPNPDPPGMLAEIVRRHRRDSTPNTGWTGHIGELMADRSWLLAYVDRLRHALLRECCRCGPTDPDPAVHAGWCVYRQWVESALHPSESPKA